MRFAYADPPYLGQAKKHYADHPDHAKYDTVEGHWELVESLAEYDAWALSCSSSSLRTILRLCPGDVRVLAWVKPFASFKLGVNPAYAWEPVILRGGRKHERQAMTERDWLAEGITLQRGFPGAKPDAFCRWLFRCVNLNRDDEFVDVFPGSGAVTKAYQRWCAQRTFDLSGSQASGLVR